MIPVILANTVDHVLTAILVILLGLIIIIGSVILVWLVLRIQRGYRPLMVGLIRSGIRGKRAITGHVRGVIEEAKRDP